MEGREGRGRFTGFIAVFYTIIMYAAVGICRKTRMVLLNSGSDIYERCRTLVSCKQKKKNTTKT